MARVTCSRPGCPNYVSCRGLCESHYVKRARGGRYRRVPAGDLRDRLNDLHNRGWSNRAIATAAGISVDAVWCIRNGQATVLQQTHQAITNIAGAPSEERVYVPSIGTQRRVQALARIGLSLRWQARQCGFYYNTLSHLIHLQQPSCMYRTHQRVADLYDQHWNTPGNSGKTIATAIERGWHPPMAWDDDTIDDPDAEPRGASTRMTNRR